MDMVPGGVHCAIAEGQAVRAAMMHTGHSRRVFPAFSGRARSMNGGISDAARTALEWAHPDMSVRSFTGVRLPRRRRSIRGHASARSGLR